MRPPGSHPCAAESQLTVQKSRFLTCKPALAGTCHVLNRAHIRSCVVGPGSMLPSWRPVLSSFATPFAFSIRRAIAVSGPAVSVSCADHAAPVTSQVTARRRTRCGGWASCAFGRAAWPTRAPSATSEPATCSSPAPTSRRCCCRAPLLSNSGPVAGLRHNHGQCRGRVRLTDNAASR